MRETTARFMERLLNRLLPSPGRHRASNVPATAGEADAPTLYLPRVRRVLARPVEGIGQEEATPVRPYVLAYEEQVRRRRHRPARSADSAVVAA